MKMQTNEQQKTLYVEVILSKQEEDPQSFFSPKTKFCLVALVKVRIFLELAVFVSILQSRYRTTELQKNQLPYFINEESGTLWREKINLKLELFIPYILNSKIWLYLWATFFSPP